MRLHRYDTVLVGLRDGGREAIVWKETTFDRYISGIVSYNVDLDTAEAKFVELLQACDRDGIDEWVEENEDGFVWLNHYWCGLVETFKW